MFTVDKLYEVWKESGCLTKCNVVCPSLGMWKTVSYSSKKLLKMWKGWRRKPSVSQMS